MDHAGPQVEERLATEAADVQSAAAPAEQPGGTDLLELWSDRPEVRAIPELLRPGEAVVCVGSGTVLRSGRLAQPRWLVVLTDRRLLCIKGAAAATRRVIDMPVGAIRSVARKGLLRSTLSMDTGYGNLRIGGLKKPLAVELVEGLTTLVRAHRAKSPMAAIPRAELPEDPLADLIRLQEEVAALAAEVQELRGRVMTLELASDQPPA